MNRRQPNPFNIRKEVAAKQVAMMTWMLATTAGAHVPSTRTNNHSNQVRCMMRSRRTCRWTKRQGTHPLLVPLFNTEVLRSILKGIMPDLCFSRCIRNSQLFRQGDMANGCGPSVDGQASAANATSMQTQFHFQLFNELGISFMHRPPRQ
jgi:hypothetical protein